MKRRFLSIGSNIEPEKNIPACLDILKRKFLVIKISSVYETDPVGAAGNQKFWNLAVEIETGLGRKGLAFELRRIEETLGRERDPSNQCAPRPIDLDILPALGFNKQPFVTIPLAEIAPHEQDPASQKTFEEIAKALEPSARSYRKVIAGAHSF